MASLLIDLSEPAIGPTTPCARCAGRAVWREARVHTFDLATGERRFRSVFCCEACGALSDDWLDEAPTERTRARAHSPASRGLHMFDLLRHGPVG